MRKKMKLSMRCLIAGVVLSFFCAYSQAEEFTWTGSADSNWSTGSNWSPAQLINSDSSDATGTRLIIGTDPGLDTGVNSNADIQGLSIHSLKFTQIGTLSLTHGFTTRYINPTDVNALPVPQAHNINLNSQTLTVNTEFNTALSRYAGSMSNGTLIINGRAGYTPVSTKRFEFYGASTVISNVDLRVQNGAYVQNVGAKINSDINISSAGRLNNIGVATITGDIRVAGGTFINQNTATVNGNISVALSTSRNIDSAVINGNIDIFNASFRNEGTARINGTVTLHSAASRYFNFGSSTLTGNVYLNDFRSIFTIGGTSTVNAPIDISSGGLQMSTSGVLNGNVIMRNIGAYFQMFGNSTAASGNLTINAGFFQTRSSGLVNFGKIDMNAGIAYSQENARIASDINIKSQSAIFTNFDTAEITGDITITDGAFYNAERITNTRSPLQQGVQAPIIKDNAIIVSGSTENGGRFINGYLPPVSGDSFTPNANDLHTVQNSNITVNTGGLIQNRTKGLFKSSTIIVNDGVFENYGKLETGSLTINGGVVTMFSGSEVSGTPLVINAGGTYFAQQALTYSNVTLKAGGSLKVLAGRTNSGVESCDVASSAKAIIETEKTTKPIISIIPKPGMMMLRTGDSFTVVRTATGLVNGANAAINPGNIELKNLFNNNMLEFRLAVVGNNLVATTIRMSNYCEQATKYNRPVACALDSAYAKPPSEISVPLQQLMGYLDAATNNAELNSSFSRLIPRQFTASNYIIRRHADSAIREFSNHRTQRRIALNQLKASEKISISPAEVGFASLNYQADLAQVLPISPGERDAREVGLNKTVNVYGRATTGYNTVGAGANRIGLVARSVGAVFGFDVKLHENIVLGFAGSYDYSDIRFRRGLGAGRVNSYRFGPYALIFMDSWFFETELTLGIHNNRFTRHVDISGTQFTPRSKYHAYDFAANIGAGYDFNLWGLTITPRANLQYQFYHAQSFDEKQGAGTNLHVQRYNTDSLITRFGVDLWKHFKIDSAFCQSATPFFNIGWRHEWIAPADLTSRFEGGGDSFNIDNELYSRNAIYLGIGSTFNMTSNLDVDIRYQADIGDNKNISHNAGINLRWKF